MDGSRQPSPQRRRGPGRPRGSGRGQGRGQPARSPARDPLGRDGIPTARRGGQSRRHRIYLHPSPPPSPPPRQQNQARGSTPPSSMDRILAAMNDQQRMMADHQAQLMQLLVAISGHTSSQEPPRGTPDNSRSNGGQQQPHSSSTVSNNQQGSQQNSSEESTHGESSEWLAPEKVVKLITPFDDSKNKPDFLSWYHSLEHKASIHNWSEVQAGTYALMSLEGSAAEVVRTTSLKPRQSTLDQVYNQLKPYFRQSLETPDKLVDLSKLKIDDKESLQTFAKRVQRALQSFPDINSPTRVVEFFINGIKHLYSWATIDQISLSSSDIGDALDKLKRVTESDTRGKRKYNDNSNFSGDNKKKKLYCHYHKSAGHNSSDCRDLKRQKDTTTREDEPPKQDRTQTPRDNYPQRGRGFPRGRGFNHRGRGRGYNNTPAAFTASSSSDSKNEETSLD